MAADLSVVVLGTGRSGTSAVAGLLAQAGVWFGDDLLWNARLAAKGLYEDRTLHRLNRQIARHMDDEVTLRIETRRYPAVARATLLQDYPRRLAALAADRPLWGVKDPLLVVAWPVVREFYPPPLIVAVHRARYAIAASFQRASGRNARITARMVTHLLACFYSVLDRDPAPRYHLDYERLVADGPGEVRRLFAWLAGYTDVPLNPEAAARFVDPALCHCGLPGG